MLELPENYDLRQAYNDIMYLAERMSAFEEVISEWSEFMTVELLKDGIKIEKHRTALEKFKTSLVYRFKEDFEKFESLFGKLRGNRRRHIDTI